MVSENVYKTRELDWLPRQIWRKGQTSLFHQPVRFELVTVRQTSHKRSLAMSINSYLSTFTLGSAQRLTLELHPVHVVLRLLIDVGRRRVISGPSVTSPSFICLTI